MTALPAYGQTVLLGPHPYLGFRDSPFNGAAFEYFYLENFEDGQLNTPGVSVDHGIVVRGSYAIDSVDEDDGLIDGSGLNGASIYHYDSMSFAFDPAALEGGLPTRAGVVFTDDTPNHPITFEAFDAGGTSLGSVTARVGDGSFYGGTAEDRFFGVVHPSGISRILVTDNAAPNHLELDHLQYGRLASVATPNLIDATYGLGAGSFELGGFVDDGQGCMALPSGSPAIAGWTVDGPGDGVDWLTSPQYAPSSGARSVDLAHMTPSSIATVIPTVAGERYVLGFDAATVSGYNNSGTVSAGSMYGRVFTAPDSIDPGGQSFAPFAFEFTATEPTTTVRFASAGTGGGPDGVYGPAIDNVSVVLASSFLGGALKISPSHEFSLEEHSQATLSVELTNVSGDAQSAALEVLDPHPGLGVALASEGPVALAPGEKRAVSLGIDAGQMPAGRYDGVQLKIVASDGNAIYSDITIFVVRSGTGSLPDLAVSSRDIRFTVAGADASATLSADIHNRGSAPASNVEVSFYEFGSLIGTSVVGSVAPGAFGTASIPAPMTTDGDHLVRVVVDPSNGIGELDETNNEASRVVRLGSAPVTEGGILVIGSLPNQVYAGSLFALSGLAIYDLYVEGVRYTDYAVKGGPVQITVEGGGGETWVYGDVHTDTNGRFHRHLQAPTVPGTYRLFVTVTDKTFLGSRELVFSVVEAPPSLPPAPPPPPPPPARWPAGTGTWTYTPSDSIWEWTWTNPPAGPPPPSSDLAVYAEDVYFSKDNPAAGEEITVFAEISYWASSTALVARDVPVTFYVTYPGTPRVMVGHTIIDSLSVGPPDHGSRYVYATWKNQGQGIYIVEVEIDPGYVEQNMLDNAATRAIIVGQLASALGAVSGQVSGPWGGVSDVIVRVFDSGGALIGSTVTDARGFYLIENVPPGQADVRITAPTGYVPDAEAKAAAVATHSISTVEFELTETPRDTVAPVLTLPADIVAEATEPLGATVAFDASATDAVDGAVTPTCTPAPGSTFPLDVTTVACSATDRAGNTATGSFDVTVLDTTAPTLVCPADVAATQGQPVVLGAFEVTDSVDESPVVTNDAPADFAVGMTLVTWTARDFRNNEAHCEQQVTISAAPPVADAGLAQNIYLGDTATLPGTAVDPGGLPIVAWEWSVVSSPQGSTWQLSDPTTPAARFTPAMAGDYVLSLVVSNGYLQSAPSFVTVHVATWLPPVAIATADQTSGPAPLLVCFDASGSHGPQGGKLEYLWSFGDGTTAVTAEVCHTYVASATPFEATVTVTDSRGMSDSEVFAISVTEPNQAPVASPTATPNKGSAPLTVQFAANASDPDGDPLTFSWDFGDGATSTDANPAHAYATAGTFIAWLTVSDGRLLAAQSLTITVSSAITLDVRMASVKWWKKPITGMVTAWADFSAPVPAPDDLVLVSFDGIQLVAAPFSAFRYEPWTGGYVLARNGTVARLDFKRGRLLVLTPKIALGRLDNSNGVDVELMLGSAVAVDNVKLLPAGKGLLVYQRPGCEGEPDEG